MALITIPSRNKEWKFEVKDFCPLQVSDRMAQLGLSLKNWKQSDEEMNEEKIGVGQKMRNFLLQKQVIEPKITDESVQDLDTAVVNVLFETMLDYYGLSDGAQAEIKKKVTIA